MLKAHPSYALEFESISKRYGSYLANESISLAIQTGQLHAIVGENGAGKSTAMKIAFGLVQPDSGDIRIFGNSQKIESPGHAMKLGMGMVHQHFMLSDRHTVLENLLLGNETAANSIRKIPLWASINRNRAKEKFEGLIQSLGFDLPLDAIVEDLSVGEQQRIEIVKVLKADPKILILDEPTAVLTPPEVDQLFGLLQKLCAQGKTVIVITHKISEVMKYADRVSVLRGGRHIHTADIEKTTADQLAKWMVGEIDLKVRDNRKDFIKREEILSWKSEEFPFRLLKGEILGIVGVEGSGQTHLIDTILSLNDRDPLFKIRDIRWEGQRPKKTGRKKGISLIAQDRLDEGVLLERTLYENFILSRRDAFFINWKKAKQSVAEILLRFNILPRDGGTQISALSGGNQQKFVVGREISANPSLLIAAQPTRGVDLGASQFIHRELVRVRDRGAAVLLITSDLDEAMKLSDRIQVIYRRRIIGEFSRDEFDRNVIGLRMGGVK